MNDRRRTPRCFDTMGDDRCRRPLGHFGLHAAGDHAWGFREAPRPSWLARLRARDETGAVLVR